MEELENIILSEETQSQKNTHGIHSLISGLAPKLRIPRHNSQTKWSSRRRKSKVWIFQSFLEGDQNTHERRYRDKVWNRDWRKGHLETAPPVDLSHIQSPNPDTIADTNKSLMKGAWYSYLLRGSASAWQTQKWMLTVIYNMEHRAPNVRAREVP